MTGIEIVDLTSGWDIKSSAVTNNDCKTIWDERNVITTSSIELLL